MLVLLVKPNSTTAYATKVSVFRLDLPMWFRLPRFQVLKTKRLITSIQNDQAPVYITIPKTDFYFFKYSIKKAALEGSFVFGMS
jgi:hypothetical protein